MGLLVELPAGEQRVLKAFSGLLNGHNVVEGWVPPIQDEIELRQPTPWLSWRLSSRNSLLKQLPERHQYETLSREQEQHYKK